MCSIIDVLYSKLREQLYEHSITLWSPLIWYGPVRSLVVLYGPIRSLWSRFVPYGPVWSNMVLYGPIQSHMVLYGPVWSNKNLFGTVWSHVVPYHMVRYILVCPWLGLYVLSWPCMFLIGPVYCIASFSFGPVGPC